MHSTLVAASVIDDRAHTLKLCAWFHDCTCDISEKMCDRVIFITY